MYLRWDVGIYVGQPQHSVEAALVYFQLKNQILVRADVAKLDVSEGFYKRFYYTAKTCMASLPRLLHVLSTGENISSMLLKYVDSQPCSSEGRFAL